MIYNRNPKRIITVTPTSSITLALASRLRRDSEQQKGCHFAGFQGVLPISDIVLLDGVVRCSEYLTVLELDTQARESQWHEPDG